ncbi:FtsQ-type POTRA domain-containing protein [Catellatospora sp. KI3]|uniref:cell division protein FtsQ/DivIB n=1 Tax=Catellatospora sp. KI3 TaxID=3041620 RepID=UPI002482ECEC|nr:FtsQ-type POTRA domain-containing protein [Catellatospora sp. KI3]MDI1464861.1 FtsQ-type POTRA domain-containing protein [Catellatospora sp. KI3]
MPDSPGDSRRRWRLVRAGTDAIPPALRQFMRRQSAWRQLLLRKRGRLRPARRRRLLLARLAAVAAVALVAGALSWLVLASPVLGVRDIHVEGALVLDADQVREAAGVPLDTPLARVDTDAVAARVAALPPALTVDVSRSWPSTLVITVVERTAVAGVPVGKKYDLFDDHGVIYRTVSSLPSGLVRVRLATPGPQDVSTQAALTVLRALTKELRRDLDTLIVDGPARIRLELRGDRVVTWGDAEESVSKAKVATALLSKPDKLIDVSGVPDVVTLG